VIKALAAVVLVLTAATADGQATSIANGFLRFQTPSKNIGCLYAPPGAGRAAYLRCDILSGVKPKPRGRCQLDWTGFTMGARARPRPTCAGDTVYQRNARILPYGWAFRQGGFVCRTRRTELRCTNAVRRGFSLSRGRSFAF
jgi:hypothetical protein